MSASRCGQTLPREAAGMMPVMCSLRRACHICVREVVSSLPIVYSCSGCSSAAQMANHVAVRLDRLGRAEMSCIAGVGGNVSSLVRLAKSGRPLIVIDGCPLDCAKRCLEQHQVDPTWHVRLSNLGVRRNLHADFDSAEAERALSHVCRVCALEEPRLSP